jgi:superoxide dismutase
MKSIMTFALPPLPHAYDALQPYVDRAAMEFHHDKHQRAYVDKLNGALAGADLADEPIEEILRDLGRVPEAKRSAVQNNGGGHRNHTMFWENMSPDDAWWNVVDPDRVAERFAAAAEQAPLAGASVIAETHHAPLGPLPELFRQ